MPEIRTFGKPSRRFLNRTIYGKLGAYRKEVVLGPRHGADNAVVRISHHRVLVATTDPLSLIPTLGPRDSAWLSIHLLASDLTTSGFAPQLGIFDFNLPPHMKDREFAEYWRAFHNECKRLGISIIGGHTGRYPGCDYTVIGGGVLCAIGSEKAYLSSAMARTGDELILTKGAAIETTAVLTRAFPRTVKKILGERLFHDAWQYLRKVTTVRDALVASSVGIHEEGVTAMHDATEGGVIAAALELATASGVGVELEVDKIPISEETERICDFFGIDPLVSVSEGSLIIAVRPSRTGRVLKSLKSENLSPSVIGRLTSQGGSAHGFRSGRRLRIHYPKIDPYWRAYWKATRRGWK